MRNNRMRYVRSNARSGKPINKMKLVGNMESALRAFNYAMIFPNVYAVLDCDDPSIMWVADLNTGTNYHCYLSDCWDEVVYNYASFGSWEELKQYIESCSMWDECNVITGWQTKMTLGEY